MASRIHREVYVRFWREYGTVEVDDRLCLPHDLDIQVSKLKLLKANHTSQIYRLEDDITKNYPQKITNLQQRQKGYQEDIRLYRQERPVNKDDFVMSVGTKIYTDKKEAGTALLAAVKDIKAPNVATHIGFYQGFKLFSEFDIFNNKFTLTMKGSLSHSVEVGSDPIGNITRLNNALEGLGDNLIKVEENLANTQIQLENAKAEVTKPFPREQELTEKLARLVELNALLNMDETGEAEKETPKETAELLASAIDQFMYDYDTYEYNDTVENQEEAIMQLAKDIVNGTADHVQDYLVDIYMQNNSYLNEAMQLLHRLEAIGAVQPEDNLAFQIADRYVTIHSCDDGYDYNIYDENYKLLDGGVYDNPDYSIREALRDVVDDLKSDLTSRIRGNVKQDDDLVKIDNDELSVLIEEAEQAQMSQLKERAEYNHLSEADIKENVLAYVQTQFDELNEYNPDFGLKIVDAAIYGSRSRGVYTEQSDIDIVVEYTGNMKESSLFNVLYEDWSIGGMKVDINPIRAEESGVLSDFLVRADKDLDEKIQGNQSAEKLTYYVAECAEFQNYGEFHDKLTLDEAVYQYQQIPSDRLNGVKGIGFELQTTNDTMTFDLYSGGRIDVDTINMIPEFKNSPAVQKAIEDIRERFPNATVIDFEQKKAQEYKPLAKVEELQECNYNMVDNVLNNGANRKPEEEKKVRARISLKEKLAEKKEEVKRIDYGDKKRMINGKIL